MATHPHPSRSTQHLLRAATLGGVGGAAFGFVIALVTAAMTTQLVGWARWFYLLTFAAFGATTGLVLARPPRRR